MRKMFYFLVALGTLAIASPASASVITFESLATNNSLVNPVGSSYTEGGYTFTEPGIQPFPLSFFGTQESRFPGSTSLFNDTIGGLTELTKDGGGAFTISSISLALLNGPGSVDVTFVGTHPDLTTSTQTFTVTSFGSETTFNFGPGFTNLSKLDWTQDGQFHQFDNLVLDPAAIPEPATLAAFALMAGCGGLYLRRRMKTLAIA